MIICIGSESYLLYFRSFALGLHFLFFFLLIIKEFIIVYDLANRRINCWGNFHQVKTLILRHSQGILSRIDAYFYILAYKSHLLGPNKIIDTMFCFFARHESSSESTSVKTSTTTAWSIKSSTWWSIESTTSTFVWYCHLNYL